jgi:hypothetical protein
MTERETSLPQHLLGHKSATASPPSNSLPQHLLYPTSSLTAAVFYLEPNDWRQRTKSSERRGRGRGRGRERVALSVARLLFFCPSTWFCPSCCFSACCSGTVSECGYLARSTGSSTEAPPQQQHSSTTVSGLASSSRVPALADPRGASSLSLNLFCLASRACAPPSRACTRASAGARTTGLTRTST